MIKEERGKNFDLGIVNDVRREGGEGKGKNNITAQAKQIWVRGS